MRIRPLTYMLLVLVSLASLTCRGEEGATPGWRDTGWGWAIWDSVWDSRVAGAANQVATHDVVVSGVQGIGEGVGQYGELLVEASDLPGRVFRRDLFDQGNRIWDSGIRAEWSAWASSYIAEGATVAGHAAEGDYAAASVTAVNRFSRTYLLGQAGTLAATKATGAVQLWAIKTAAGALTTMGTFTVVGLPIATGVIAGVGVAWLGGHIWDWTIGSGADYLTNAAFDRSTRGAYQTEAEARNRLINRGFSPEDIERLMVLFRNRHRDGGFMTEFMRIQAEMDAREEAQRQQAELDRLEQEALAAYLKQLERLQTLLNHVIYEGNCLPIVTDPRSPVRVLPEIGPEDLIPIRFLIGDSFVARLERLRSGIQELTEGQMDLTVHSQASPAGAQVVHENREWSVNLPLGEHPLRVTLTVTGIPDDVHGTSTLTFVGEDTVRIVTAAEQVSLDQSAYQTTDGTPVTFRATASQLDENITYAYSWTVGEQTHTGPSPTWTLTPRLSDPEQQEQRVVQVSLYDVRCGTIVAQASATLTILVAEQPPASEVVDSEKARVSDNGDGTRTGNDIVLLFHEGPGAYANHTVKYWYYLEDHHGRPVHITHGEYRQYRHDQLVVEGQNFHGRRTGTWRRYHPNGNLRETGDYIEGKRTGTWSFYREDGSLISTGDYRAVRHAGSERTGTWRSYFRNGNLESTGDYDWGRATGTWHRYHSNGSLLRVGDYVADRGRTGTWREYHSNGNLREVGDYVGNRRTGTWRFYDLDGNESGTRDYSAAQ